MKQAPKRALGFADDLTAARPGLQSCIEAALNLSDVLMDSVIDGLEITVSRAHGATAGSVPKPLNLAVEHLIAQRVHRHGLQPSFFDPTPLLKFLLPQ